jgi:hypothetical protein
MPIPQPTIDNSPPATPSYRHQAGKDITLGELRQPIWFAQKESTSHRLTAKSNRNPSINQQLAPLTIEPYHPSWGGWLSAGSFIGAAILGGLVGKQYMGKRLKQVASTAGAQVEQAINKSSKKALENKATHAAANPEASYNVYRNIDSPLLTMAFLASQPAMKGVLGWFAASSIAGFIGGNALSGLKDTWVRAEETAIRMRAMDEMVSVYQQSVRERHQFLSVLKEQTRHTIRQWLGAHGINPEKIMPSVVTNITANNASLTNQQAEKLHTNYLLEPRKRPPLFSAKYLGNTVNSPSTTPVSNQPLTPLSAQHWWPWMAGGVGLVTGLVVSTLGKTVGMFNKLVGRTLAETTSKETITSLFVKNTEALAVLAKQLEAPALLLTYGVAVGLITAGKHLIEGIRDIAVTEENTKTELGYQQYKWQQLGSRLMAVSETEWVANQLSQLAASLNQLNRTPQPEQLGQLQQKIEAITEGIGFNSAPPHYNTPIELNITEARS